MSAGIPAIAMWLVAPTRGLRLLQMLAKRARDEPTPS
jgi:hypothetical protein